MNNPLAESVAQTVISGKQVLACQLFDEIATYCEKMENGYVLPSMEPIALRQLVAYHYAKDTLTVIRDDLGKICGVHMWYRCPKSMEWSFVDEWHPDTKDNNFFLAFLYSSSRGALQKIAIDLIKREPDVLVSNLILSRFKGGERRRIDVNYKFLYKILKHKGGY